MCDTDQMVSMSRERDAEGVAQLEVARVGSNYPFLSVLFKDGLAVVLRMDVEAGDVMIAKGDGSIPADTTVEFRGPEGPEPYTGRVIVADSLAMEILLAFADEKDWPQGVRWLTQ